MADDKPMVFKANPPDARMFSVQGNAWSIYADGVITSDTPRDLKTLIEQNRIPSRSRVFLNSPGGSLIAGMELGRLIRESDFDTYLGKAGFPPSPGECYSACTLAYLGGHFRYLTEGGIFGVHRFFLIGSNNSLGSADALAAGQIGSAAILEYIREMGADPDSCWRPAD